MHTIIVATDLSERADRAVQRAFLLARETGAKLIVATVVDDGLPASVADLVVGASADRLAQVIAANVNVFAVEHVARVLRGDPAPMIVGLAATEKADLLVLGLHRPRLIADMFRETTMERIVRHVRYPVLLVSAPAAASYAGVLAAIDFSSACAAAVRHAHALAPKAPITAVHALHVPYRGLLPADTITSFLGDAKTAEAGWRRAQPLPSALGAVELVEGAIEQVLAQVRARTGADLLALGAHGRSGVYAALVGSLVARLMREPLCDLLIARPE